MSITSGERRPGNAASLVGYVDDDATDPTACIVVHAPHHKTDDLAV
jgi:hypothetical protein